MVNKSISTAIICKDIGLFKVTLKWKHQGTSEYSCSSFLFHSIFVIEIWSTLNSNGLGLH